MARMSHKRASGGREPWHTTHRREAGRVPLSGAGVQRARAHYLTDADVEARETLRVLRPTSETDERLVRYWFCSTNCRTEFVEAVENGACEETLYDD
jgi:hypothetical protein